MTSLAFEILWRDQASPGLRRLGEESDRTQSKMQKLSATLDRQSKMSMQEATAKAAGFGKALVVTGAVAAGFGLKVAAGNEQAKISFTTMLGSAQEADKFLRKLQQFAATTPFEFPELQTAASSLISAGVNADKVIPIMRTLGDVTAGIGTGSEGIKRATIALQQMNAAGRITGEDLNQLRDAGIPVYDLLAKATGKSKAEVVKLAQAGKLGAKELGQMMAALESGAGLERFSGLMEAQAQSLEGMISTLKDTLGQGLATALQPSLPAIKDLVGGLTDAVGFVTRNTKVIGPFAVAVGGMAAVIWTANKATRAFVVTQTLVRGMALKSVGGLNALKVAFTGVELSAVGAGRAMKVAQLSIPVVGVALFAATTAMQYFATKADDGSVKAEDFADAMETVKGKLDLATAALNENVRAGAVKKLQDAGAFQQAKMLGLSYDTVTDAALGNKEAIAEVNSVVANALRLNPQMSKSNSDMQNAARGLVGTMGGVSHATRGALQAEKDRRAAMRESNAETIPYVTRADRMRDAQKKLKKATGELNDALQDSIDKLSILKDGALSMERANIKWEDSLDNLKASVKSNGKSLDSHTAKGRANRQAIVGAFEALDDKTKADYKNAASSKNAEGAMKKANDRYKENKKDLRNAAIAAGYNKEEVDKMIKKYLKTPKEIETKIKNDAKDAKKKAEKYQDALDDIDNEVNTNVGVKFGSSGKVKLKAGNKTYSAYAAGGVLPGYSPGRDNMRFYSDRGDRLDLAGGESIMVPQWTRAVGGPRAVAKMNREAASGKMWAYARGGTIPSMGRATHAVGKVAEPAGKWVAKNAADWVAEQALAKLKAQAAAYFAATYGGSGGGGNGGYSGPVGSGASGIRRIARSYNPSYIAGHRDPQGGPAFDIGSSGSKNSAIANALRSNHGKLGLRYVISRMKISSARSGWGWRRYTPITGSGDFRHVNHVHVSYDRGGLMRSGTSGVNTSGQPERVLTGRQTRSFENLVQGLAANRYQVKQDLHFHFGNYVGDRAALMKTLSDAARTGQIPATFRQAVQAR